jgi:hypothetical protein
LFVVEFSGNHVCCIRVPQTKNSLPFWVNCFMVLEYFQVGSVRGPFLFRNIHLPRLIKNERIKSLV